MKKILSLLLLFICAASVTLAQELREFSVTGFVEKPFDTSARDERYKIIDGNADLFSIIKLVAQTRGDDLRAYSFDFGMPESRIKEVDGEVWVYVQRNAMRVTIKREGFKTVKYELSTTVQPGHVYEMTLRATPRVIKKRHLLFQVSPADSKAYIQYKAEGESDYRTFGAGLVNEDGMLSEKLQLGRYFYKITSSNYHLSEGVVELTDEDGSYTEQVTLRPNYGTAILEAEPGAVVYIDEDSVGVGACTVKLSPGLYNVECRKVSHRNTVESIEVKLGDTVRIALESPEPITGAIDIVSTPLKATIAVDGKVYGNTPAEIKGVLIGSRNVEISKDGYIPQTFTVDVKENETTELKVTLEKGTVEQTDTTLHPTEPALAESIALKTNVKDKKAKADAKPVKKTRKERIAESGRANLFRRQENCSYFEPAVTAGHLFDVGLNLGYYLSIFNMEFYGYHGLQQHTLYSATREYVVTPVSFGGRLGVGIQAGRRMAFTPQLGMGGILVYGNRIAASAATLSLGLRCELFFGKHIGMSLTPEYVYAVLPTSAMQTLRETSNTINNWCTRFVARLGFHFNF